MAATSLSVARRGLVNLQMSFWALAVMASAFARNKITFLRFTGLPEYTDQVVAAISRVLAAFVENGLARPS